MTLGDNDVGRQSGFEPPAQAFALDQRNRRKRQSMALVVAIQDIHAGTTVFEQSFAVMRVDKVLEQAQVAAEIEDASLHQIAQVL